MQAHSWPEGWVTTSIFLLLLLYARSPACIEDTEVPPTVEYTRPRTNTGTDPAVCRLIPGEVSSPCYDICPSANTFVEQAWLRLGWVLYTP